MAIPILGDIIDSVIGGAKDIISEVVVDKDKRDQVNLELEKLRDRANERANEQMLGQVEVNKVEAAHRSIFVAGWRPAIGWVGALSLFMYYPVQIAVQLWEGKPVTIDVTDLIVIVTGMLGFGVQRSFDKLKGTSNDVLPLKSK